MERRAFDEHPPPHFHAAYGDDEAVILIATSEVLEGHLPPRALRLVREWAEIHRPELHANWDRTQAPGLPVPIAPLP